VGTSDNERGEMSDVQSEAGTYIIGESSFQEFIS